MLLSSEVIQRMLGRSSAMATVASSIRHDEKALTARFTRDMVVHLLVVGVVT
jgi:hypothetical protein